MENKDIFSVYEKFHFENWILHSKITKVMYWLTTSNTQGVDTFYFSLQH